MAFWEWVERFSHRSEELRGRSGQIYRFMIFSEFEYKTKDYAAVYVFFRRSGPVERQQYKPAYIGISKKLSERFDDHHKMNCIRAQDANVFGVLRCEDEEKRKAIEIDLISNYSPKCNEIGVP